MALFYKPGDLLQAPQPIIIHGCNAQGVMGSGVAKAIREKWPEAYVAYKEEFTRTPAGVRLGDVVWARLEEDGMKFVGNAITQEYYGRDARRYVDYDAIDRAFTEVRRFITEIYDYIPENYRQCPVAIPLIGAGLGGGDWEGEISIRIIDALEPYDAEVYLK